MMNREKRKYALDTGMIKDLETLIKICQTNLKNSPECLAYLRDTRGMSEAAIENHKIGYFPQSINMLTKYVSRATLEKLNIIDYSGNSKFADFYYLVFPIYNEYGEPVGINGRTLISDTQREMLGIAKYENSSFKKSTTLFGFNRARGSILAKGEVFVCEGNFDAIQLQENGIKNSVAICGTGFSKDHFVRLARYAHTFTFVLDSDDGGRKAISRINKKFMNKGIKLRFLSLPDKYKDVDDFFRAGYSRRDFFDTLTECSPELENMEWKN